MRRSTIPSLATHPRSYRDALWPCVLTALAAAGCLPATPGYECSKNADCTKNGMTGTCIGAYCAFPANGCGSGLRFDPTAGHGLGGACVPPVCGTTQNVMVCAGGDAGPVCANLQTDNSNCGACGHACATGQTCAGGACAVACPGGLASCGTDAGVVCVNLQADRANCGACGKACAAGQICDGAGHCALTCVAGQQACPTPTAATYCANLAVDSNDCGACGNACPAGQACVSGACKCPAATPNACSADGGAFCTSFLTDPHDCGGCGTACAAGQVCSGGACAETCAPSYTPCPAAMPAYCASTTTDPTNCGGCGIACPAGASCAGGTCTCPAGQTACSSACTNLQTDASHCGACANACASGLGCVAGSCVVVVPPRPVAPLSTSIALSQHPKLSWKLGSGSIGALVEVCLDRACGTVSQVWEATGTSTTVPGALVPRFYYWRLHGIAADGSIAPAPSATWQMTVGAGTGGAVFGSVLDVNGDGRADAAIGAPTSTPSVTVYLGPLPFPSPQVLTSASGSGFGAAVASAGDVNGDGYGDLLVGAPGSGRAYVYFGGPGGLPASPSQTLFGATGSQFGYSLASAGDVNGDGYADVIVGELNTDTAFVYYGGPSGLAPTPTALVGGSGTGYGVAVAGGADVNGDGFDDVVVGAPAAGAAYVYAGGAAGVGTMPAYTLAASGAGSALAVAGDINGDGYADVLVGAQASNQVYVFDGGASGPPAAPSTTITGAAGSAFGWAVAYAGDVNADGYSDVIVGAPSVTAAYAFLGASAGLATSPATTLTGPSGSSFGRSVALFEWEDIATTYGDVLVGASAVNAAYVFHGIGAGGLSSTAAATLTGAASSNFGSSVAMTTRPASLPRERAPGPPSL